MCSHWTARVVWSCSAVIRPSICLWLIPLDFRSTASVLAAACPMSHPPAQRYASTPQVCPWYVTSTSSCTMQPTNLPALGITHQLELHAPCSNTPGIQSASYPCFPVVSVPIPGPRRSLDRAIDGVRFSIAVIASLRPHPCRASRLLRLVEGCAALTIGVARVARSTCSPVHPAQLFSMPTAHGRDTPRVRGGRNGLVGCHTDSDAQTPTRSRGAH